MARNREGEQSILHPGVRDGRKRGKKGGGDPENFSLDAPEVGQKIQSLSNECAEMELEKEIQKESPKQKEHHVTQVAGGGA